MWGPPNMACWESSIAVATSRCADSAKPFRFRVDEMQFGGYVARIDGPSLSDNYVCTYLLVRAI